MKYDSWRWEDLTLAVVPDNVEVILSIGQGNMSKITAFVMADSIQPADPTAPWIATLTCRLGDQVTTVWDWTIGEWAAPKVRNVSPPWSARIVRRADNVGAWVPGPFYVGELNTPDTDWGEITTNAVAPNTVTFTDTWKNGDPMAGTPTDWTLKGVFQLGLVDVPTFDRAELKIAVPLGGYAGVANQYRWLRAVIAGV